MARSRWHRPLPKDRFWALGASEGRAEAVRLHLVGDMTFLDARSWMLVLRKVAKEYTEYQLDPSHDVASTAPCLESKFFGFCMEPEVPLDVEERDMGGSAETPSVWTSVALVQSPGCRTSEVLRPTLSTLGRECVGEAEGKGS